MDEIRVASEELKKVLLPSDLKKPEKLKGKFSDSVWEGYLYPVLTGKRAANKAQIDGAKKFLKDLEDFDWDPTDADKLITLIECSISHMDGNTIEGKPLRGQPFELMEWMKFICYGILGFYHPETHRQKVQEVTIHIPRKNSKTCFAAALVWGLSVLYCKSGAQTYIVAGSLDQSLQSFRFLKYNIVRLGLPDCGFRVRDSSFEHSIEGCIGEGEVKIKALASNPDAQDSYRCLIAIADECHSFKRSKQYTLFQQAQKSYGSQKKMIGISTAGDDPRGFWALQVEHSRKVLAGQEKDDQLFAFICEADKDADGYVDYLNPLVHESCNPSYGTIIRPWDMEATARKAETNPKLKDDFFTKELNVFRPSEKAYFNIDKIQESDELYSWTEDELAQLVDTWYAGVDLSEQNDLTAACLVGLYSGVKGDVLVLIPHAFMPITKYEEKTDRQKMDVDLWKARGELTICNGEIVNFEDVVQWFKQKRDDGFYVKQIAYDSRFSYEFVRVMAEEGFEVVNQVQWDKILTEGFKEFEKKALTKKLYFGHNAAFLYCLSNVKASTTHEGFTRYEKMKPELKIDMFDAAVFGIKRMLANKEEILRELASLA